MPGGIGEEEKRTTNIYWASPLLDALHILFHLVLMAPLVLLSFYKCNSQGVDIGHS